MQMARTRRSATWLAGVVPLAGVSAAALTATAALVPGVGAPAAAASRLPEFRDCAELRSWYARATLPQVTAWGLDEGPVPVGIFFEAGGLARGSYTGAFPQAASSATGTNVQEAGVDEPDIAKTDGRRVALVDYGVLRLFDATGPEPQETASLALPFGVEARKLLLAGDSAILLGGDDGQASVTTVDLSDPAAPAALLAEVEHRLGLPTILVNNAAHSTRDGWRALDAATLDAHYAVNLRATALLSVGLARRLADRPEGSPGGRIVNLTSGQGRGPMPGELAYASSKGAIEALTVTLAAELGPYGITVNAVDPGPTDTGWMSDGLKAELLPRFPLGRIGVAQDAARLIAFLVSDAGNWITGEVIHSTGGFR